MSVAFAANSTEQHMYNKKHKWIFITLTDLKVKEDGCNILLVAVVMTY